METTTPNNDSGILVEHKISIRRDDTLDALLDVSRRPSVVSAVSSVSDAHKEPAMVTTAALAAAQASGEGQPLRLNGLRRHPDVMEDRLGQLLDERRDNESLQYLIDFLRQSPPADNFMSMPDPDTSGLAGNHKCKAFNVLRKRKQKPQQQPPNIKLPDSAVAATTIDGHRHIAISIPLEYCHLTPLSASQYPVYDSISDEFQREIDARLGPMTNSLWDHTGHRLHTIGEDPESMASAPVSPSHRDNGYFDDRLITRHSQVSLGSQPPRHSVQDSTGSQNTESHQHFSDFDGTHGPPHTSDTQADLSNTTGRQSPRAPVSDPGTISQPRNEPTASRNITAKSHARRLSHNSMSSITSMPNYTSPSLPSRISSRRASLTPSGLLDTGDSIDNVIATRLSTMSDKSKTDSPVEADQIAMHRKSFTESLLSTDSVPKVLSAQAAKAYQNEQIPIIVRPPSRAEISEAPASNRGSSSGVPRSEPVESSSGPESAPAPQSQSSGNDTDDQDTSDLPRERPLSRKDKVRQRKSRDMEALKMQCEQASESRADLLRAEDQDESLRDSAVLARLSQNLSSTLDALQPPPLDTQDPESIAAAEDSPPEVPEINPARRLRRSIKRHSTPLLSNMTKNGATSTSPVTWDRASSQRRKERQAAREAQLARRERYLADIIADQDEATDFMSREELLLRYEDLKSARAYDMEKRLRRLERNAEVWLRSMLPLMENLNRLMQEQNSSIQRITQYPPYLGGAALQQQYQNPATAATSQPIHARTSQNQTKAGWTDRSHVVGSYSHYTLRAVRSFDSPLDAMRPRTAYTSLELRPRMRIAPMPPADAKLDHKSTLPADSQTSSGTPVQDDLRRALIEQRARQKLNDEINALLRGRDKYVRGGARSAGQHGGTGRVNLSRPQGDAPGSNAPATAASPNTEPKRRTRIPVRSRIPVSTGSHVADDSGTSSERLTGNKRQAEPLMDEFGNSARLGRCEGVASLGPTHRLND